MRDHAHARERGFGAAMAVVCASLGALALVLAAAEAARMRADAVEARRGRIQRGLDARACSDSAALAKAKDAFARGRIVIADLGCPIDI